MRLSIQIEFDKTLDLETGKELVTVGRSQQNDLVIGHDSISRKHCQIEYSRGTFYITDLGSSNGTFVDGQRLEPQIRSALTSTQQLILGKLECELSESFSPVTGQAKVISSDVSSSGDYTATMRISRIDLNRPVVIPPAVVKKTKPAELGRNKSAKSKIKKIGQPEFYKENTPTILFIILALVAAWFMAPN